MADPTITTAEIDRFVTRSAFEVFLLNLLVEEDGGLLDANDPALDEIDTITLMLSTPISRDLWPLTDEHEWALAHTRQKALVSRLFAVLAAAEPGFYAHKAAHFAGLVEKHLAAMPDGEGMSRRSLIRKKLTSDNESEAVDAAKIRESGGETGGRP